MPLTLFKKTTTRIAPLAIITLLALLSWWLKETTAPTQQNTDSSVRHDPDYYSDNMDMYLMDKTGQLHHQIKVKHLKHYPDDDSTQLTEPQIALYQSQSQNQSQKINWTISSEQGEIINDGKEIMLTGNVIVTQTSTKTKMTTDSLLVHPDQQYAQTNSRVTLEDSNGITHAIGMKAYIGENNIQLLSRVRGRYVSP